MMSSKLVVGRKLTDQGGFFVSLMKDGSSAEERRYYDIAAPDENEWTQKNLMRSFPVKHAQYV